MTETAKYGKWEAVKPIGRGGQGQVYLVRDTSGVPNASDRLKNLRIAVSTLHGAADDSQYRDAASKFADEVRQIVSESETPLGALKELLPFEDGVAENEVTALDRMKRELSTLQSVSHPSLVKVLDSDLDEKWFVMEFFGRGTLSKHLEPYKGRVLDALLAFRPIVDAVYALHTKDVVHRDIKPDNIFVASDGHLVLGDCGLAFKVECEDRLTLTWENVGTRDFQPPWTQGARLVEVQPTFDVFSLAKVLWTMVSGRPKLQLWYFDLDGYDLRQMFPNEPAVQYVHEILGKCLVQFENQMKLHDAGELLGEIDSAIAAVSAGCQVPGWKANMRCRFCGIGTYKKSSSQVIAGHLPTEYERNYLVCGHCGHVELFVWPLGKPPPVWNESNEQS